MRTIRAAMTVPGDGGPTFGLVQFRDTRFSGVAPFGRARFTRDVSFIGAKFLGIATFGRARFLGRAQLGGAQFDSTAEFDSAKFDKGASFGGVRFKGGAKFDRAHFRGTGASFGGAQFGGAAWFGDAEFKDVAWFDHTQFSGVASFDGARFHRARFDAARFNSDARFAGVQVSRSANFDQARFEGDWLGPFACTGPVWVQNAAVSQPTRLQISAHDLYLCGTRFDAAAVLRLRHAQVDLTDVALGGPLTVASQSTPFVIKGGLLNEQNLSEDLVVSVRNLSGVDAANLVLTDVDLSRCLFSGAYHLDQIRFEGRCAFAHAPRGRRWGWTLPPMRRWTKRKVLAEEHAWRAAQLPGRSKLARRGWDEPDGGISQALARLSSPVRPESTAGLAVLYRQLRKALEDGKDEPGAADFYYGEMEARRHDPETPLGERLLLHGYWLLSGYALRASRALGALTVAAGLTFMLMMAIGLPNSAPSLEITGIVR
jgi:uncharacterized protein YjbI with pentapeptide repeats